MGRFGEDLRQQRESRGVTLEAITEATKISNRHLLALEAGQFDKLPGGLFHRSILRSYAQVVGLDPQEWLDRYAAEIAPPAPEDLSWTSFAENVGKSRKGEDYRPPRRLRWAGVGMLALLIAGLGWCVYHFVWTKVPGQVISSTLVRP